MLNSILQVLAEMMVAGTRLTSTEQIDFSQPSTTNDSSRESSLNLYLYDVRSSKRMPISGRQVERRFDGTQPVADIRRAPGWFDVSLVVTARDQTILGEHQLISELLCLLMRNRLLREEFLTSDLRGHGDLALSVTGEPPIEVATLWNALSVPIRPAIYLTVTVPVNAWRTQTVPLVTERQIGVNDSILSANKNNNITRKVNITGIIKNLLTSKPLKRVKVKLEGTEKTVNSNQEGYFFFENMTVGNYVLQFRRFGYQFQTCNVEVDGELCIPKEIYLTPS